MLLPGLFTLFSCTGCDNEVNPGNEKPLVDITTVCRSVQEMGGYATFYKPQAGYVGDPMPYYNEADNSFYVFFLQDWRNGAPTDHPVYFTKTSDYSTFQGFTEAIPNESADSQEQFLGTGSFIKDENGKMYGFIPGITGTYILRKNYAGNIY